MRRGQATLLDSVDWTVRDDERWVVLGANGAGKTTLVQLCSAQIHPSSGVAGTGTVPNTPLPNLGLNRVYVLASAGTCSASESVINGLRGIDVEVIVLGSSTCGKPYGFTAKDNCGLSYFPV